VVPRYVQTALPTFTWASIPTAVRHEIWLDNLTLNESKVVHDANVPGTTFTVSQPMTMSLYRAWIRGFDLRGQASNWSAPREFYVAPRPQTDLTALATFDRTPTLSWHPVLGATKYQVWVRNMWTSTDLYQVSDIQTTDWTIPEDLNAGRHQWWVRGFSDNGITGHWSFGRELFVGGQPRLLSPSISPDRIPTFQWYAVEGASLYQLQVDRIDVPVVRVFRQDQLTSTTWSPQTAMSPGQYRLWVRAISSTGELSFWSREFDFSVTG
jgi:hypothetical protein